MENKKLGIIGGMGPMATSMFFERIVSRTVAAKDQDHIDLVIFNHASMPDRTSAILSGDYTDFLREIGSDIKAMETLGMANIAIPCNTSHYFMHQMQAMTSVPIINMVKETVKYIREHYGEGINVGILATNGTIFTGTYEKACAEEGLHFIKPDEATQNDVMKIIYDIKADLPIDVARFEAVVNTLVEAQGCQCVILACTELSLIQLNQEIKKYCIDAMDVLVEKAIVYSGRQCKPL